MPTIRRILETALYCEDLTLTTQFYERLLERAPLLRTERLVSFDAGQGTVLLLFQRGRTLEPLETPGGIVPPHDGTGPAHIAFAIDADELGAWRSRLAELGVAVESELIWDRGGRSLYFRDPDRRSIELATPGTWPTY